MPQKPTRHGIASAEMIAIFPGCDFHQLEKPVLADLTKPVVRTFMIDPGNEMNGYSEFRPGDLTIYVYAFIADFKKISRNQNIGRELQSM
jgi:hypothetical protein